MGRKNPRAVAALGFPAHYLFRAHVMWCAREKDAGKTTLEKPLFINEVL
jgi:hypothetical protein